MAIDFQLKRNAFNELVLTKAGVEYVKVSPVRAFPIQTPDEGISMVHDNGAELAWIEHINDLPEPEKTLVQDELDGREFMPEISSILNVSSFSTPCTWSVVTDRGETEFVLKGEEDIRRIGATSLLISDNHGIHFLIRDMFGVDKHSRRILDRFL
jgi:hypothetical protein